jgi:hypothetical protein
MVATDANCHARGLQRRHMTSSTIPWQLSLREHMPLPLK